MKPIFDYSDYKVWVREGVRATEHNGRGTYRRLAARLKLNTSMISQIFNGTKDLSIECALELADFYGLSPAETDYLVAMVDLSRAGSERLRTYRRKKLDALRSQGNQIANRLPPSKELSDGDKAVFYSHWYYSAIALLCGIKGTQSAQRISNALGLPLSTVRQALEFLVTKGLVNDDGGALTMGTARTHVPQTSPLVARHHANWRIRALARAEDVSTRELMFTSPMTLSESDAARVRAHLVDVVASVSKIVDPSPSEQLWCMNMDLLKHI